MPVPTVLMIFRPPVKMPRASVPQVTLIALGKALDVPAENRNGTVYAPVRALCEALGYSVRWQDGVVVAE